MEYNIIPAEQLHHEIQKHKKTRFAHSLVKKIVAHPDLHKVAQKHGHIFPVVAKPKPDYAEENKHPPRTYDIPHDEEALGSTSGMRGRVSVIP